MASFDTDHIINPFRAFGDHLWDALHAPSMHALMMRLTGLPGTPMPAIQSPPHGHWIVCGYGRFGREVVESFLREGLSVTIVEPEPPADERHRFVRGLGTEAATLMQAGLASSVGIVAGTDDDINNLSIAMTARAENPRLYIVVRQNLQANRVLFGRFGADMTMVSAQIIANECLARIGAPLLGRFMQLAAEQTEAWAAELDARLQRTLGDVVPEIWQLTLDGEETPALLPRAGAPRATIALDVLLRDPTDRARTLPCVPLFHLRGRQRQSISPPAATELEPGDAILFAGNGQARRLQSLLVRNSNVLRYVETGVEAPGGYVWQRWARRRMEAGQ